MNRSDSGGGKVFGRFGEPAHRVLGLAREEAERFGRRYLRPEHLVLGVLEDPRQPATAVRGSRRHRQIIAHVGLPDGSRGAAGLLLAALQVDLDQLGEAVAVELGRIRP